MVKNVRTRVVWNLHDYCSAPCSYCPDMYRHGSIEQEFYRYKEIAVQLIKHYTDLGRGIDWIFNGGEPLEMFDFPELLKLCKVDGSTINLTSNGGKLWIDWWAVEPYVDALNLTYHAWQNPNLIKFIVQIFIKKNKYLNLIIPIRAEYFNEDIDKAKQLESEYGIQVTKQVLYHHALEQAGYLNYSKEQYKVLTGIDIDETVRPITFAEKSEITNNSNPVYTNKLCNAGIETLHIGHTGWVKGSMCNNVPLGNIWNGIELPSKPQICKMRSCVYPEDKLITKFD